MSLSTYFLQYGRHVARLRRRAYAPTSNTASHDNHKENPSWVFFFFPMMPMGLRLAALRAAGAPVLGKCLPYVNPFLHVVAEANERWL